MAYNSGNNPSLVKTAIDSVFFGQYDYDEEPGIATALNPLIFRQATTSKGAEITEEYEGPGAWEAEVEEEERNLANIRTGNQKTHTVLEYRKTLKIPQTFFEDDMHDSVNRTIEKVGLRGRTTRDKNALNVYVDGFSAETTSDGVAIFSGNHIAMNKATIDNLETGALSGPNLKIVFKSLLQQKAQDGDLGGHVAAFLLVPTELFPLATEVTKSELIPGKMDNDLNYFSHIYPGLQVFQSPYLGVAYRSDITNADTSYYVGGRNHSIMRWVRVPIETKLVPPDTDDADRWTYKARYRELVSAISWEGLVGSNGTT